MDNSISIFSFVHYDLSSSFVIGLTILILAYRTCECNGPIFYQGLFQQKSRLDIAGKSMFLRYLISVIILFVALMIQKDLLVGFLLVVLFNIFFIVGFDIKFSRLFRSSDNKRTFFEKWSETRTFNFKRLFFFIYIWFSY